MNHIKYIVLLLALIAVSWGVMVMTGTHQGVSPNIPTPYKATLTGTITCLPKKGSGPQTMECAYGIQTDDGAYHALHNIPTDKLLSDEYMHGTRTTLEGMYTEDGGSSPYAIKGTLDVSLSDATTGDTTEEVALQSGDREGSFEITAIYADRVEGLNYMEYPVAREEGMPVTLRIGEVVSNGCTVILTLMSIEGDVAVFEKLQRDENTASCPICLSEGTLIQTPGGAVPVESLKKGDIVITLDASGNEVSAPIIEIGKTPAPSTHQMIRLVLADGRTVHASPNHPLSDGRAMASLAIGDRIDGSHITSIALLPYTQAYTYDILPEGETGIYIANDIPLASTLK